MKCKQALIYLSCRQDGELSDQLNRELKEHLAGCNDCRAAAAQLHELQETLQAAPVPEWPIGLQQKIMRRINEKERPRPRLVPAVAYSFIFAFFFILTIWLSQDQRKEHEQAQSMAAVISNSQQMSLLTVQDNSIAFIAGRGEK